MNSRDYAKFKRLFVGPTMPKKVMKQRGIGYSLPMPAEKIPRKDKEFTKPVCNDWRSVRHGINLKNYITPNWANKDAIDAIYKEAKELSEQTGIKYQVDHIIPVRHPYICGLHNEFNLRIIPATENKKKSNFFTVL